MTRGRTSVTRESVREIGVNTFSWTTADKAHLDISGSAGLVHDMNLIGTLGVYFRGVLVELDVAGDADLFTMPGLWWRVEFGQVVVSDDDRVGLIRIGMSQVYECGVSVVVVIVVDTGDRTADFMAVQCGLAIFLGVGVVVFPLPAGVVDSNQKGQNNTSADNQLLAHRHVPGRMTEAMIS